VGENVVVGVGAIRRIVVVVTSPELSTDVYVPTETLLSCKEFTN
jgi:hypothetical protein